MTPTQAAALERLRREGALYPYGGVSTRTVAALEKLGLAKVDWREPTLQLGTLGSQSGARGRWVRNWVARPAA